MGQQFTVLYRVLYIGQDVGNGGPNHVGFIFGRLEYGPLLE